jgi:hypothetical protein
MKGHAITGQHREIREKFHTVNGIRARDASAVVSQDRACLELSTH